MNWKYKHFRSLRRERRQVLQSKCVSWPHPSAPPPWCSEIGEALKQSGFRKYYFSSNWFTFSVRLSMANLTGASKTGLVSGIATTASPVPEHWQIYKAWLLKTSNPLQLWCSTFQRMSVMAPDRISLWIISLGCSIVVLHYSHYKSSSTVKLINCILTLLLTF